jgi:hypothetical protein
MEMGQTMLKPFKPLAAPNIAGIAGGSSLNSLSIYINIYGIVLPRAISAYTMLKTMR